MDHLIPLLEQIGLNHYESRIYLHLLSLGESPASRISKDLHMPRSTVRGSLDKLCEAGIVSKIYKRNTQYYHCKDPNTLKQIVEQQQAKAQNTIKELEEVLPSLTSLFEQRNVLPKVQFYEGEEQVIEAFNSTLFHEEVEEILVLTSYDFLENPIFRKHDDDFYIPLRVKKGITLRSIVGDTSLTDKGSQSEPHELRERRFFPKKFSFPGTFYIYGDFVLYFSVSNGEYLAVITESTTMAETMRVLHTFMWKACT